MPDAGSPPRGRGARLRSCGCLMGMGITPAWAGSTTFVIEDPQIDEDHPRVGGEHLRELADPSKVTWITPAWAGSTLADQHLCTGSSHFRVGHSARRRATSVAFSAAVGLPMSTNPSKSIVSQGWFQRRN